MKHKEAFLIIISFSIGLLVGLILNDYTKNNGNLTKKYLHPIHYKIKQFNKKVTKKYLT